MAFDDDAFLYDSNGIARSVARAFSVQSRDEALQPFADLLAKLDYEPVEQTREEEAA
jgi:hypothetical protein